MINRYHEGVTEKGEYLGRVFTICQENIVAFTLNHHREEIIPIKVSCQGNTWLIIRSKSQ